MARLSKEQIQQYKDYFLSCVDGENYERELKTDQEKIQFVYDCFYSEYWNYNKNRKSFQNGFSEYLSGLPSCVNIPFTSCVNIPFTYCDILQLAEGINGKLTEKEEDRILENYWMFMSGIFIKLCKQFKIKIDF